MQRSRASKTRSSYAGPPKAKSAGSNRSRINVTNFKSVTDTLFIPPEMNTILAAVGGEITIKLGPGSQSVQVTRNGAIIMTEPEVREISRVNDFVKKERKSDISVQKAGALESLATRIILAKQAMTKGWKPNMIGPNQLTALREREAQLTNLGYNLSLIEGNKASLNTIGPKQYLVSVGSRLRNAIAESALTIVSEGKSKDIYECSFERRVPRWAVVRLANSKLTNIDPSTDLMRLIFPKDFTKGVTATIEEIRNADFVAQNGFIFQRSGLLRSCMLSDEFVKMLIGFDEKVKLNDATNSEALRVMKCIVTLPPVEPDLARLAKSLESRGATMKWATRGQAGNFKAILLAFSHSMLKAFFGLTKGPDRFNSWWKLCFPNDYNTLVQKDFTGVNNTVGHWLGQTEHVKPPKWELLFTSYSRETRDFLIEAILLDLGGFREGQLATLLKSTIGNKDGGITEQVVNTLAQIPTEEDSPSPVARAMAERASSVQEHDLKSVRSKFFAVNYDADSIANKAVSKKKRGSARDPTQTARGTVSDGIEKIIEDCDEIVSKATIKSSFNWLRNFSDPGVRLAAAHLLAAKFDAYADEEDIDIEQNADYYSDSDDEEPAQPAVPEAAATE